MLVQATRSFANIIKGEIHEVDAEAPRIASLIEQGFLVAVKDLAQYGDRAVAALHDLEHVMPSQSQHLGEVADVVNTATVVAKDVDGGK